MRWSRILLGCVWVSCPGIEKTRKIMVAMVIELVPKSYIPCGPWLSLPDDNAIFNLDLKNEFHRYICNFVLEIVAYKKHA